MDAGLPPGLAGALGGGGPPGAGPGPGPAPGGLPPGLSDALSGGPPGPGGEEGGEQEPATLDNALEHIKMGNQMLQELMAGSTDPHEQSMLGKMSAKLSDLLAGHATATAGLGAGGPSGGGAAGP
jgi:hypothetical protein